MELTKVFITKYAFTNGIMEEELEFNKEKGMCSGKPKGWYMSTCFFKNEFCLNKEQALANCEERRIKKLQSLHKQIKKTSKLTFK